MWNARNQLTGAPGNLTYAYDSEGHRTGYSANGSATGFVVDPHGPMSRVLWRVRPDGTRTFYVYGPVLLYEIEESTSGGNPANAARFYHYDHLGSTIALTNDAGAVTGRANYSAYGATSHADGDIDTPFLYNGAFGVQTDPNGLLHMRARYYHAYLGRFMSEDPIGLAGGSNVYAYAEGCPLLRSDSSGLWFGIDDAIFAGGGALIGMAGKFVANVVTGSSHHWEDYAGAAAGGAAGGEALLYTANPFVAGAVGGAVGSVATQSLNNVSGRQHGYDLGAIALDTGLGAATGFIPGRPRIGGLNMGRGSDLQVFRQVVTKAQAGSISAIQPQTAVKMASGAFYEYAVPQGAAASAIGSTLFSGLGSPSGYMIPTTGTYTNGSPKRF